jgi:hypothetical protein
MKSICLIIGLTLSVATAHCQITKNNWMTGGSIYWLDRKLGTDKSYATIVTPDIGYFLIDNFAAGINLKYSREHFTSSVPKITYKSLSAGPFARYYFLPGGGQYNFFVEGAVGFGANSSNQTAKQHFNTYSLAAGPVFFFTTNVGLEFSFEYTGINYPDSHINGRTLTVGVGFQIHLSNSE